MQSSQVLVTFLNTGQKRSTKTCCIESVEESEKVKALDFFRHHLLRVLSSSLDVLWTKIVLAFEKKRVSVELVNAISKMRDCPWTWRINRVSTSLASHAIHIFRKQKLYRFSIACGIIIDFIGA